MIDDYATTGAGAAQEELPPRPAFLNRLWMVFVQPGDLFRALALNPAWFPAAVFVALITAATVWMMPAEMFMEAAAERMGGQQSDAAAQLATVPPVVMKAFAAGGGLVVTLLFPVVLSAVTFVMFVFIRGDRAGFKQHLCVVAHAGVVSAFGGIVNAVVNLRGGDIEQQLSVGTFFFFLPEGFLLDFLSGLGLFTIWVAVVAGIGLAAIDPRRSAHSTAGVLLALLGVVALIQAFL